MTIKKFRPSILVVFAFVAAMVLTVRVGGIASELELDLETAEDLAVIETSAGGNAGDDENGQVGPDGDLLPVPVDKQDKRRPLDVEPTTGAGGGIPKDPSIFTDAEIEVLQKLAKRRAILDGRETDIELREGLLKAAEKRVEAKISELGKLQKIVAALVKQQEAAEQKKIESLVSIYEKMKPADAARIFSELELPVLLTVLKGMKNSKVAPILAAMDSKKAKEITSELAAQQTEIEIPPAGESGS